MPVTRRQVKSGASAAVPDLWPQTPKRIGKTTTKAAKSLVGARVTALNEAFDNAETPEAKQKIQAILDENALLKRNLSKIIESMEVDDENVAEASSSSPESLGEESLFVSSTRDTTPATTRSSIEGSPEDCDDPEDVLVAPSLDWGTRGDDDDGDTEGVVFAYFGRPYALLRHGPPNASKFSLDAMRKEEVTEGLKDLNRDRYGQERDEHRRLLAKRGEIVTLQGVVSPDGLSGLYPKNWKKTSNGSERPPYTLVKVKWRTAEGDIRKCWETRGTVREFWVNRGYPDVHCTESGKYMTIPEDVEFGGEVVLKKGEKIRKADHAILNTAIRCEERHTEFLEDNVSPRIDRPLLIYQFRRSRKGRLPYGKVNFSRDAVAVHET
ncbi:hypothetical protein B0T10DRAFT_466532 [Thelonectria olida]|uniref:Uncharacterized protein n=1 Tax=Thelonectria olida TaxID=1576542 RepID=A0A9P9AF39_9HYPO|nr:hypothetical protein B0T10DRAFT_466532 [Thelonectria olida]